MAMDVEVDGSPVFHLVSKLLLCFSRFGGPASGQEGLKAYFASRPHLFEAVVM